MIMVQASQNTQLETWWQHVQTTAEPFFTLIETPPSQRDTLPVISAVLQLHEAHQRIVQMNTPSTSDAIREKFLNAMTQLQKSLAELINGNPDMSDTYYERAYHQWDDARQLLALHGLSD